MKRTLMKSLRYPKFIPFILLFFTLSIAQGATFPQPPEGNSFYVDTTNSIDSATGEQFNQVASQLLADEDFLFYVVFIQSLAEQQAKGQSLEQYATKLFNNWGLGSQGHRLDQLLLASLDDSEQAIIASGVKLTTSVYPIPKGLTNEDKGDVIFRAIDATITDLRRGGKFNETNMRQRVTFPQPPERKSYYVDTTNSIIDDATGKQINQVASQLVADEAIPIYVVVIQSLAEQQAEYQSVAQYAARLFDNWRIGSQARNYGMLLLVSLDDREARIELGAGFQHNYDDESARIMDTLIIPQFRKNQYSDGILAGVEGLNTMARKLDLP